MDILPGKHSTNTIKIENPIKIEQEAREYAVSLWFKWETLIN